MSLVEVWNFADSVFRWDGWRALAALGTFAVVYVALRRDTQSERLRRDKIAALISAIVDSVTAAENWMKKLETLSVGSPEYEVSLAAGKLSNVFSSVCSLIESVKMEEMPSVEAITTVAVLKMELKRLDEILSSGIPTGPEHLLFGTKTLGQCAADLSSEIRLVVGKDFDRHTIAGHRSRRDKKLYGSARMQSLRVLPSIIGTIFTGKARP